MGNLSRRRPLGDRRRVALPGTCVNVVRLWLSLRFTTFRSSLLISRGRQAFYQNLFELTLTERPPFKAAGAWLTCGAM